jgi:hypothetical protein
LLGLVRGINAVENLVMADGQCNGDKKDLLASPALVGVWTDRNRRHGPELRAQAEENRWESDLVGTEAIARSIYGHLPAGPQPFWRGRKQVQEGLAADALVALAKGGG